MRNLTAVREVARCQSFTEAAARLYTTQSNISIAIRETEEILGTRLFERTTKRFALTTAGVEFVSVVERILDDLQAGIDNAQARSRLQKGILAIGVSPLLISALFAQFLADYHKLYPHVDLRVHDTSSTEFLRLLHSRTVELVVGTFTGEEADLTVTPLFQDPLMALVHPSTRLTGRCTWRQLLAYPLVAVSRTSTVGQLIDRTIWKLTGEPYQPMIEVQYWTTAIALAQRLSAVCIVPTYAADAVRGDLRKVQVTNPRVVRTISLAYLSSRELSPVGRSFIELMKSKSHSPLHA